LRLQSDLAILDLAIAQSNAIDLVRRLRAVSTLKIIAISAHEHSSYMRYSLAAGADAFIIRRSIASDLLPAIDAVFAGQTYVSGSVGAATAGAYR
jgi:two-component system secretion response regulator SsrB